MKIIFEEKDRKDIAFWLKNDWNHHKGYATVDKYLAFVNSAKLDVEMPSFRSMYECWKEDFNFGGDF